VTSSCVPWWVRRGVSVARIGNALIAQTWLAGFWAATAGAQVAIFYGADLLGARFAQDFDAPTLSLLRISGFVGTIVATITVLLAFESARAASTAAREAEQRALERRRIWDDMHDGVGSQLVGLIVRSRSAPLSSVELVARLEACLDDLRLIVDSLSAALHGTLPRALHPVSRGVNAARSPGTMCGGASRGLAAAHRSYRQARYRLWC
jgi:signal transduction histidine kinase